MKTILIAAENEDQILLIQSFMRAHHLKNRILSDDDKEDIILGRLMEATDYNDTVDTGAFLSKLYS